MLERIIRIIENPFLGYGVFLSIYLRLLQNYMLKFIEKEKEKK